MTARPIPQLGVNITIHDTGTRRAISCCVIILRPCCHWRLNSSWSMVRAFHARDALCGERCVISKHAAARSPWPASAFSFFLFPFSFFKSAGDVSR
jgi:hypothetical protein